MKEDSPSSVVPAHVAIVMDGNGRWAADRGLPRLEGHRRGADVVRDITTHARECGVRYLTLYSFSTENWLRPPEEIAGLMQLLEEYCWGERETLMRNGIRLSTIGRLDRLPETTRHALASVMEETRNNTEMTLVLAVDYGARQSLVRSIRDIAVRVRDGELSPEAVDEAFVSQSLDTGFMPDPDLWIRTSGEARLSNFLLWELSYAELTFTSVRWPDFDRHHFQDALDAYGRRERRFGQTSEQIIGTKPGA